MQVNPIKNYIYTYTQKPYKNVSFCAQPLVRGNIGFSNLRKITSEAEYNRVFESLKSAGVGAGYWKIGDKYEQGLMPYIGKEDISAIINSFLRYGRIYDYKRHSKYVLENIVRIMDYALDRIDEVYGKYEGVVYRYGKVDKKSKNFVSTARDPYGVLMIISEEDRHRLCDPFHIIYTKNGHKIEEVQKKLGYNPVYTKESEILLSPAEYEEITTVTPEMQKAKENLLSALNKKHIYPYTGIIFLKQVQKY